MIFRRSCFFFWFTTFFVNFAFAEAKFTPSNLESSESYCPDERHTWFIENDKTIAVVEVVRGSVGNTTNENIPILEIKILENLAGAALPKQLAVQWAPVEAKRFFGRESDKFIGATELNTWRVQRFEGPKVGEKKIVVIGPPLVRAIKAKTKEEVWSVCRFNYSKASLTWMKSAIEEKQRVERVSEQKIKDDVSSERKKFQTSCLKYEGSWSDGSCVLPVEKIKWKKVIPDIGGECARVKGKAKTFRNSCADECTFSRFPICTEEETLGCDCGESRCWYREKGKGTCIPNPEWYKRHFED